MDSVVPLSIQIKVDGCLPDKEILEIRMIVVEDIYKSKIMMYLRVIVILTKSVMVLV